MKWLRVIINKYFGGFIGIEISNKKNIQKEKRYYYYNVEIKSLDYTELVLHKNNNIFNDIINKIIIKNYTNKKCKYTKLHNYDKIKDLYKKKTNNLFINDYNY